MQLSHSPIFRSLRITELFLIGAKIPVHPEDTDRCVKLNERIYILPLQKPYATM